MVSALVDKPMMKVEILEPNCGADFSVGDTVGIKVKLDDAWNKIDGRIFINGQLFEEFNNLNGPVIEYDYLFDEAGNFQIIAEANNTNADRFRDVTNIMIVNEASSGPDYYVASCIDEPKHFTPFTTNRIYFNSSSSRGIRWEEGSLHELDKSELLFNWTFVLSNGRYGVPCVGLGNQDCLGKEPTDGETVWNFHRYFPTVNDNKAYLSVSIASD